VCFDPHATRSAPAQLPLLHAGSRSPFRGKRNAPICLVLLRAPEGEQAAASGLSLRVTFIPRAEIVAAPFEGVSACAELHLESRPQACAATSRISTSWSETASGTADCTCSLARVAASSDSKTIIASPVSPFRVQ
jgi:hypothetical protein